MILEEQKKEFIENDIPEFCKKMELYGISFEDLTRLKDNR